MSSAGIRGELLKAAIARFVTVMVADGRSQVAIFDREREFRAQGTLLTVSVNKRCLTPTLGDDPYPRRPMNLTPTNDEHQPLGRAMRKLESGLSTFIDHKIAA